MAIVMPERMPWTKLEVLKYVNVRTAKLVSRPKSVIALIICLVSDLSNDSLNSIPLIDIATVGYLPKPLTSGGLIKVTTKKGKGINLTPSFVGQQDAMEFIKKIKEKISWD